MDISIVVPVYGCPSAIPVLHQRLTAVLDDMQTEYEIILVDDCDRLGSWDEVQKVALSDKRVKAIHFARNFGQGEAITAGIREASGDWIVTMDCDLQDSPESIPLMYAKAKEGYDVVFARRCARKESFSIKFFSKMYHKVISYLSQVPYEYELATFLIASNRAAKLFADSKDRGRDFAMFLVWSGYKRAFVEYEQNNRFDGKSSYSFAKKIRYATEVITTFSNRLLLIPVYVGAISAVGSIGYIIFVFISYFTGISNPEGWSTIVASIFFFGGVILSTLGIIGIYLGNLFDVAKDRPLFIVQEKINCE